MVGYTSIQDIVADVKSKKLSFRNLYINTIGNHASDWDIKNKSQETKNKYSLDEIMSGGAILTDTKQQINNAVVSVVNSMIAEENINEGNIIVMYVLSLIDKYAALLYANNIVVDDAIKQKIESGKVVNDIGFSNGVKYQIDDLLYGHHLVESILDMCGVKYVDLDAEGDKTEYVRCSDSFELVKYCCDKIVEMKKDDDDVKVEEPKMTIKKNAVSVSMVKSAKKPEDYVSNFAMNKFFQDANVKAFRDIETTGQKLNFVKMLGGGETPCVWELIFKNIQNKLAAKGNVLNVNDEQKIQKHIDDYKRIGDELKDALISLAKFTSAGQLDKDLKPMTNSRVDMTEVEAAVKAYEAKRAEQEALSKKLGGYFTVLIKNI